MSGFVSCLTSRGVATLSACALAVMLTIAAPTKANADAATWAAGAVAATLLGIVFTGGQPKPTYEVIARYCKNPDTGLYDRC